MNATAASERALSPVATNGLALEGHDSEPFSFLASQYVAELSKHEFAQATVYAFGDSDKDGRLCQLAYWNGPECLAWNVPPPVAREANGWVNYAGHVTQAPLVETSGLVLVRYLFTLGYRCAFNDRRWVNEPADPMLTRLSYIREYLGHSTASLEWPLLCAEYFDWCLAAMELGVDLMRSE